jgi:hypothetical protein
MSPLSFLNQDNYQIYNRQIAKFCESVSAAIMLSELVNRFEYHVARNELSSHPKYGDGWFYLTVDKAEDRTCLSRKEQLSALKILKNLELIESCEFGLPNKRYFKLKENKILQVMGLSKNSSSTPQTDVLDGPERTYQKVPNGRTAHIYKEPNEEHDDANEKKITRKKKAPKKKIQFDYINKEFVGIEDSDIKLWQETYPLLDIKHELLRMKGWLSNPETPQRTKIQSFIINWLNKGNRDAPFNKRNQKPASQPGNFDSKFKAKRTLEAGEETMGN